jgi:hypothetical protein
MAGRPIPVSEANKMIEGYLNYLQDPVDMNRQTHHVTFSAPELMTWLNQIMPRADELRVCFGRYPEGHPQGGKLTVILWPYKDGKPTRTNPEDPPYNEGTGQP